MTDDTKHLCSCFLFQNDAYNWSSEFPILRGLISRKKSSRLSQQLFSTKTNQKIIIILSLERADITSTGEYHLIEFLFIKGF